MTITSSERGFVPPTDASRIRELLHRARLSQATAARVLEIDTVTFRAYCAAKTAPPRYVLLALKRLGDPEVRGVKVHRRRERRGTAT